MKILVLSDTHNQHKALGDLKEFSECEMIIHAGDVSGRGWYKEVAQFVQWYKSLDFKYKLFIPGNHDFYFEGNPNMTIALQLGISVNPTDPQPDTVICLIDHAIEIEGIKIWGSPVTPTFHNWAFNKDRGSIIEEHWKKIPEGMDIIVTHGPAKNILDECMDGHVGCEDMLNKILEVKPKYHIGGHIHEGYGTYKGVYTTFINPSVLDGQYNLRNKPIVIEI